MQAEPVRHVFVDVDAHVPREELEAMAPGLQAQLNEDLQATWGLGGGDTVVLDGGCDVEIQLHADAPPDEQGALAIHDVTEDGRPIVHAYAGLAARCGVALSSCISHELLEARCDPDIQRTMTLPDGRVAALEVCDQVEADSYLKAGVEVSNFNTPANYHPTGAPGERFDFLGLQTEPFEVRPGGYAQTLDPDKGWTQITNPAQGMRDYRAELARLKLTRLHLRAKRDAAAK